MTRGAWRMSRYPNALRFALSRQANAYAVTLNRLYSRPR